MTVAVGDVVRGVAEWDMPESTIAQMVWHWIGKSGTTATEAQVGTAIELAIDTAWDRIDHLVSDEVDGAEVEGYLWDFALDRWDGIFTAQLIGADGANATEMLPHGAAALLKTFTAANRRQGRKYVPGMGKDTTLDGIFSAGTLTDVALFGSDMDDDIVAGGLTLAAGTFNTDPTSPLFETFSEASGAVAAEAVAAYQRRRRPGTGI